MSEGLGHHEVVIAGSGFSGMAMAMALKEDGVEDFVMLERGSDLGGTWRVNTYPGCACDVPSVVYSLAGEPNPRWSKVFAPREEIWNYIRGIADRTDLRSHLVTECELLGAKWDSNAELWRLQTTRGDGTAGTLISAVGGLSDPKTPALPGLEGFAGTTFHSAEWRHDHDLRGRKVAVIGTGASAVQFVPYIQPEVKSLHLFQRTPPWINPRPELEIPEKWRERFARFPIVQRLARWAVFSLMEARQYAFRHPRVMARMNERMALSHLERQVPDPELRRKLTPNYRMGCKRILASSTWFPALAADNSEVVTAGISEITADAIVTDDGERHEVDTIIFATGFHVTDQPIAERVRGRDGRTIAETWAGSMSAYLGTAVAGFPNFFMLLGPNTGLGHNSVLLMMESQVGYIRRALTHRFRSGGRTIEPRAEAVAAFAAECDAALEGSVWTAGGCESWYLDDTGRGSVLWPGTVRAFQERLEGFSPDDHRLDVSSPAPAEAAVA